MKVDFGGGRERTVRVDYPSNAKKQKAQAQADAERVPVETIVTGAIVERKRGIFGKIHDTFIGENSGSVLDYVVMEVLVPAAKNTISDAVTQTIERMMFGESRVRQPPGTRPGYTNYSKVTTTRPDSQRVMSRQAQAQHDFSDFILASRVEAEEVLDRLRDLIDQYQLATVSDLKDLLGVSGEFTDEKWGWFDLRAASVRHVRGGYLLVLPRTLPVT